MRVMKVYAFYGDACGNNGYGQAEDYLVTVDPSLSPPPTPPLVSSAMSPDYLAMPGLTTTLTLTLTNYNAAALALTADADTLPVGLVVANPPNAATTCIGGSVSANPGDGLFSLSDGAQIPGDGTCTVSVDLTSADAGIYVNTVQAGTVQSANGGNPQPASATVQFASPAGVPTYATGFEAPFNVANLNGQQGWDAQGVTAPAIVTTLPATGTQHARLSSTSSVVTTNYPLALSPVQPAGTSPYSSISANLRITRTTNGSTWEFDPQDFTHGLVITRVRLDKLATRNIMVPDFAQGMFVNTGAQWPVDTYFNLAIIVERATGVMDVCMDGVSIYHDAAGISVGGTEITDVAIMQALQSNSTANNTTFVDDLVIDNSAVGTCSGLPLIAGAAESSADAPRQRAARSALMTAARPRAAD